MSGDKDVKVVQSVGSHPELSLKAEEENEAAREKGRSVLYGILCEILDKPEEISVTYHVGDRTTIYKVECHPKTLGQLIGAKGKNISGIRAVISAMMARKGIRAIVEIPYIEPSE